MHAQLLKILEPSFLCMMISGLANLQDWDGGKG